MDAHQDLPQISSWPFSPSCRFIPCLSVISNPWLSRLSTTTGLELHPQVKWGSPHRKPVPCCLHPHLDDQVLLVGRFSYRDED